jgi:hypothetical protein
MWLVNNDQWYYPNGNIYKYNNFQSIITLTDRVELIN